jgi:hypothetical protein
LYVLIELLLIISNDNAQIYKHDIILSICSILLFDIEE